MRQFYRSIESIANLSRHHATRLPSWVARFSIAASLTILPLGFVAEVSQAYPRQTSVGIAQQQGDSYNALVRRAETAARTAAQQIFDGDILVSEVAVTVVGESGSAIVPILTMRVSRDQWRSRPDPQQWSTYFPSARSLLELGTPSGNASTAAGGNSTIAPSNGAETPVPVNIIPPPNFPAIQPAAGTPASAQTNSPNPVQINLPATPAGEVGLPRSILR